MIVFKLHDWKFFLEGCDGEACSIMQFQYKHGLGQIKDLIHKLSLNYLRSYNLRNFTRIECKLK